MDRSRSEINKYLVSVGWGGSLLTFVDYYERQQWNNASSDAEAYENFKIHREQAFRIERGNFQRSHCAINNNDTIISKIAEKPLVCNSKKRSEFAVFFYEWLKNKFQGEFTIRMIKADCDEVEVEYRKTLPTQYYKFTAYDRVYRYLEILIRCGKMKKVSRQSGNIYSII